MSLNTLTQKTLLLICLSLDIRHVSEQKCELNHRPTFKIPSLTLSVGDERHDIKIFR